MKRACLYLSAVLLLSVAALAQSTPPSGDTYTYSAQPKQNNGSQVLLAVQSGANAYIQFNLSTLPAGASVSKATLRLFADAVVKGGSFNVYSVTSSWTEGTLTWNTAPTVGAQVAGPISVTTATMDQFVLIDVTTTVQGWVSGATVNNGLALELVGTNGSFSFDSKESFLTAHQPELEIEVTGPTGATGAQGPIGPIGATGAKGATGNTGATGPGGPAGATGAQGPIGLTGATGAKGATGNAGPTGATGPAGATGATGSQGVTGATGAQGPIGPIGFTGAQGPAGTNGTNGTNGTGFNFRAAFDNTATYAAYDVVTYNGSSYDATVAIAPGGGTPDTNPNWALMAQEGAAGAVGAAGATGPQGPQGNTGNTGQQGPIGNTGATGVQGPIGLTGTTGATGSQGPIGFTGAQGPAGTNGTNGTNGAGFTFRGLFVPNTSGGYNLNDVVSDTNGSSFIAILSNAGTTDPASDTTDWTLIAQAGAAGAPGAIGPAGSAGSQGPPGPQGTAGSAGPAGSSGAPGIDGATGPAGPAGPQGATGDVNARMIFPSFYPGNLTGTWLGNQFTLDQAITVLRIAAVAKTATGSTCPAAVFRLTNSTKGQDLVLTPGRNWSDTGAIVMTFNAGDVLQASLRTGSTCAANTGADANLLVEYKMQAAGDTDTCSGMSCNGFCTTTSADPSNCGTCGTACTSGTPCTSGSCTAACGTDCGTGSACSGGSQCASGICTSGICQACASGLTGCNGSCVNLQGGNVNNCGACGNVCNLPNATPFCSNGGICTVASCATPFANCDGIQSNGCETSLLSNNNCGACGAVCSANSLVNVSGASCEGSCCGITACSAGWGNCTGSACAGGCFTNFQSDSNNCGGCNNVCNLPNAASVCSNESCQVGSCNSGWGNCDGNPANGCETNLNNNNNNCGACGKVCGNFTVCSNGQCVL